MWGPPGPRPRPTVGSARGTHGPPAWPLRAEGREGRGPVWWVREGVRVQAHSRHFNENSCVKLMEISRSQENPQPAGSWAATSAPAWSQDPSLQPLRQTRLQKSPSPPAWTLCLLPCLPVCLLWSRGLGLVWPGTSSGNSAGLPPDSPLPAPPLLSVLPCDLAQPCLPWP